MAAPVPDAPCVLLIDGRGNLTLRIAAHDGELIEYLIEPAPSMLDDWAVLLRRVDGKHGPYRVARTPRGRWKCSCADTLKGRARKEARQCKHRYACAKLWALFDRIAPRATHHDHDHEDEVQ